MKNAEVQKLQPSAFSLQPSRSRSRGMALVITLILLSVTLVMIIALLAVARRERLSVGTSTDATTARLATETALQFAQGQIIANLKSTNAAQYNYGMLVSTNYNNDIGYLIGVQNPTNVNYFFRNVDHQPLNGADFLQNVANLQILPRAPVMVSATEPLGRYYLDLNRNGEYDTNGFVENVDANGNNAGTVSVVGDPEWIGLLQDPAEPHAADNKFLSRYAFIVLPVGQSLDLNYIHNENIGRNVMQSANSFGGAADTFMRNQGVGSWEINLAAFLADLNTNQWNNSLSPYQYLESGTVNKGNAFNDALSLVSWRYNYNYNTLLTANSYFTNTANYPYNIDLYGDGPLQTTFDTNAYSDFIDRPWPGADNTNRFYSQPADVFDPAKSYTTLTGFIPFTNRLMNAGMTAAANGAQPTYDRYTYYRMLEQLGTDTLPANVGKLNLNFSNAVVIFSPSNTYVETRIISGAETNLVPWRPLDFFSAAADKLLRTYSTNWFQNDPSNYLATYFNIHTNYYHPDIYNPLPNKFVTNDPTGAGLTLTLGLVATNQLGLSSDGVPAITLTNIPVIINSNFVYSPAVNRLLQLAANIYDASTVNPASTRKDYPHIFRPMVYRDRVTGNVFINGFEEITNTLQPDFPLAQTPIHPADIAYGQTTTNVYGLPWIIGAKKGFPSFNQFVSRADVQVTRKIQVRRAKVEAWTAATAADFQTNMMYVVSITNHIGFSFWNPYSADYVSPNGPGLSVVVRNVANMTLSNYVYKGIGPGAPLGWPSAGLLTTNYVSPFFATWPGSAWDLTKDPDSRVQYINTNSFIAGEFDVPFLQESAYSLVNGTFTPTVQSPAFDTVPYAYNLPQFNLMSTNGFQAYIVDGNQVLDYVQFSGPTGTRDVNAEISDVYHGANNAPYHMWFTNNNYGYFNQLGVSLTGPSVAPANSWVQPPNFPNVGATSQNALELAEADMFKGMFTPNGVWTFNNGKGTKVYNNTNLVMQAPYTPQRTAYDYTMWQANDPQVHYLASDLNETIPGTTGLQQSDDPLLNPAPDVGLYLTAVRDRYQPWGRDNQINGIPASGGSHSFQYNIAMKDSLLYSADNWDFPTNKYPTVGWLGRVHRGTPWQTVYLKSTNFLMYGTSGQPYQGVGFVMWTNWTGNANTYDAVNTRPVDDLLLFDVFTAQPNDNASRGTLSVNQPRLASWSALLSGMVVLNNNSKGTPSYNPTTFTSTQTNLMINPAGVDLANSSLYLIVSNIDAVRTTFPNGVFRHVGEILQARTLTEQSPFINASDAAHQQYDISDELYEWLPQQMMGLVRLDSQPRYVVYSFGQALKPAPGATVLSSQYYGLVTNYQVVAESATRAVVTVQPSVVITNNVPQTNYNLKVESFNVLPPQ